MLKCGVIMDRKNCFKYLICFIITIVLLIIIYIIVYLVFSRESIISAGVGLSRKDWLSFSGGYISFAGTIIVSLLAFLQTKFYFDYDNKKELERRKREIQPIFNIKIESVNHQIKGTAQSISLSNTSSNPKHQNVEISFENVGNYPIKNVIVFDNYIIEILKPNQKTEVYVAYHDSPDLKKFKKKIIEIFDSEYDHDNDYIPKWFNIVYEDVDGNSYFQTFELKEFDNRKYYSLEKIEDV